MNLMLWLGWTTSPPPARRQRLQRPAHTPHRRDEGAGRPGGLSPPPPSLPSAPRPPELGPDTGLLPTAHSRLRVSAPAHLAASACGRVSRPASVLSCSVSDYPAARVRALPCGVGALEHLCAPLSSSGQRRGWHPPLLTEGRSEREADLRLPQRPRGPRGCRGGALLCTVLGSGQLGLSSWRGSHGSRKFFLLLTLTCEPG